MEKRFFPKKISEWLGMMMIAVLAMLIGFAMLLGGMDAHGTDTLLLQLLLKFVTFGVPAFMAFWAVRKGCYCFPKIHKMFSGHQTVMIVVSSIGSIICLEMLYSSVFPMTLNDLGITAQTRPLTLALLFLVHVAAPAVLEEMLFRGVLMRALTAFRGLLAILISSLVFGLMHISLYGFPIVFVCGFIIGVSYLSTGSLAATTVVHFSCNAFWYFAAVMKALFPAYEKTVMQGLFGACVLMVAAGLPLLKMTFSAVFDEHEEREVLPSSQFWSVPIVLFLVVAMAANLFFGA